MLENETVSEIATLVRSAFYDKDGLLKIFCEQKYEPDELDPNDVSATIESEFAKWESEKETWPEVTDCDRLDKAFDEMNSRGVIALQNAGYTQDDGCVECREIYQCHYDKASVVGYCFYHEQDLERAVVGGGLHFGFGPIDPKDEQTIGREVGNIVREELEKAGLKVDWDGTFDKRLSVPELVWQRR